MWIRGCPSGSVTIDSFEKMCMSDYFTTLTNKAVYELSLSKGGLNNFRFLELLDTAEDGGNLPPEKYGDYGFTTCWFVRVSLISRKWACQLVDSLENRIIKARKILSIATKHF